MSIATLWDAGSPQAPTGFSDWGEAISDAVDLRTDQAQWRQTHDESLSSNDDFPELSLDANYQSAYIEFDATREESSTGQVVLVSQTGSGGSDWRSLIVSENATAGKTTETRDGSVLLLREARIAISGSIQILGKRRVLSQATAHNSGASDLELSSAVGAHLSGAITAFRILMVGGTFSAGSTVKVWQFF